MVIWFIGKSASGKTLFGQKLYNAIKVNFQNIVFLFLHIHFPQKLHQND